MMKTSTYSGVSAPEFRKVITGPQMYQKC